MDTPLQPRSFLVRIVGTPATGYSGTVERLRTRERHRFEGLEALMQLIVRLDATDSSETPDDRVRSTEEEVQP
jgi:hypothetical protein